MISYSWNQKRQVLLLKEKLERDGFKIWIDREQVASYQSLPEAFGHGISNSKAIILCISKDYEKSRRCKAEAEYADRKQKPNFWVKVKDGKNYEPKSDWLDFLLGDVLYHILDSPETLELNFPQLQKAIYSQVTPQRLLKTTASNVNTNRYGIRLPKINGNASNQKSNNLNFDGVLNVNFQKSNVFPDNVGNHHKFLPKLSNRRTLIDFNANPTTLNQQTIPPTNRSKNNGPTTDTNSHMRNSVTTPRNIQTKVEPNPKKLLKREDKQQKLNKWMDNIGRHQTKGPQRQTEHESLLDIWNITELSLNETQITGGCSTYRAAPSNFENTKKPPFTLDRSVSGYHLIPPTCTRAGLPRQGTDRSDSFADTTFGSELQASTPQGGNRPNTAELRLYRFSSSESEVFPISPYPGLACF